MTAQFGCEQTGKREFRVLVLWRGQRHWIGYRDNQADAMAFWSLKGHWDGKPPSKTEGLPKPGSTAQQNQGLSADKIGTRYPSTPQNFVRVKPADSKGFRCECCGAEMFRARGRFCSDRCRKSARRHFVIGAPA